MGRSEAGLIALLTAAGFLAIGAARSPDAIDRYAGGGRSLSPDGMWSVSSPRAREPDTSAVWLERSDRRVRRLLSFERVIEVTWANDRRHVVVVEAPPHLQRIHVYSLAPRDRVSPDRIENDIELTLQASGPRLESVENRLIALGGDRRGVCVLVEESGLPFGRREGSFAARRAAFALDLDTGRASRISVCPYARID